MEQLEYRSYTWIEAMAYQEKIDKLERTIKEIRDYCKGNEDIGCHITEHTIEVLQRENLWDIE